MDEWGCSFARSSRTAAAIVCTLSATVFMRASEVDTTRTQCVRGAAAGGHWTRAPYHCGEWGATSVVGVLPFRGICWLHAGRRDNLGLAGGVSAFPDWATGSEVRPPAYSFPVGPGPNSRRV